MPVMIGAPLASNSTLPHWQVAESCCGCFWFMAPSDRWSCLISWGRYLQSFRNNLAQRARQRFDRVWFLNQFETMIGGLRQHVAVTAGQHDRQMRVLRADDPGHLHAVHAGHDDVGKHQIERPMVG